jgi:hypothetical protein
MPTWPARKRQARIRKFRFDQARSFTCGATVATCRSTSRSISKLSLPFSAASYTRAMLARVVSTPTGTELGALMASDMRQPRSGEGSAEDPSLSTSERKYHAQ